MNNIVACVPVELKPEFPNEARYSTYEKVECPMCHKPMWLGERSKVMLANGTADSMCCMFCIGDMIRNGAEVGTTRKLTDEDH